MTAPRPVMDEQTRIWELIVCAANIRTLRQEAATAAMAWGLAAETVEMVRLSVAELLTNVLNHVPDPRCRLELRRVGSAVFVFVHDRSRALPRIAEPGWSATTGRGLLLLSRTGKLGWTPTCDGKRVWILCAPWPAGGVDEDPHAR